MVAAASAHKAVKAQQSKAPAPALRRSGVKNDLNKSDAAEVPRAHQAFDVLWKYQPKARALYTDPKVEIFVAILIGGNFLTNLVEASFDPTKTKFPNTFGGIELFFTIAFTFELAMNLYAFWFFKFWYSAWNVFDFVVVTIGLLMTFNVQLPGPMRMLRMMRAFRVFRLFKRIKSLNKIMTSLVKAIPGVVNAFIILALFQCIYAMLAVELFREYGLKGLFQNEGNQDVPLRTSRGQLYGLEYFGNFPKAFYTLFQVMTGDSWSEAVSRPMMHGTEDLLNCGVALYFVSFQILCSVILINIVVAVLLGEMVEEQPELDDGDDASSSSDDDLDALDPEEREAASQLLERLDDMRPLVTDVKKQLERIVANLGSVPKDVVPPAVVSPAVPAGAMPALHVQSNPATPTSASLSMVRDEYLDLPGAVQD